VRERLQKVLAAAGVASRRAAETLILEGRVCVNGSVAVQLGTKVDPSTDAIRVDGERLRLRASERAYLVLHKPRGYLTTLSDPRGRPTIRDLLGDVPRRVFPVGRLDYQSEGLLILTDDGDLAHALMHPSRGVEKTYLVKVKGQPDAEARGKLAAGVLLDGRRTLPARIDLRKAGTNSWLEARVHEGRKHLVRRMFAALGYPVLKLRRIGFGGIELGSLPSGRYRNLTAAELRTLRRATGEPPPRPARQRGVDRP